MTINQNSTFSLLCLWIPLPWLLTGFRVQNCVPWCSLSCTQKVCGYPSNRLAVIAPLEKSFPSSSRVVCRIHIWLRPFSPNSLCSTYRHVRYSVGKKLLVHFQLDFLMPCVQKEHCLKQQCVPSSSSGKPIKIATGYYVLVASGPLWSITGGNPSLYSHFYLITHSFREK